MIRSVLDRLSQQNGDIQKVMGPGISEEGTETRGVHEIPKGVDKKKRGGGRAQERTTASR